MIKLTDKQKLFLRGQADIIVEPIVTGKQIGRAHV